MNLQVKVHLAGWLMRTLGATWRLDWQNLANIEAARQSSPTGNVIHAIFHGNLAILAVTLNRTFNLKIINLVPLFSHYRFSTTVLQQQFFNNRFSTTVLQ